MLQLRTALCSDQSDVCILKKLSQGMWIFQVISVSLGDGTQRNEECLIQRFQLSGRENIAEEAKNYLGLVGKQLLSTSCETCLESDWLCGRVMAHWPNLMNFNVMF